MSRRNALRMVGVGILAAFAISVLVIDNINLPIIGERNGMKLGLDLYGGVSLIYQAEFPPDYIGDRDDAMEGVLTIIRERVDAYGVSDAVVQRSMESDSILVQLPGVSYTEAEALVGSMAELDFREQALEENGGNTALAEDVEAGANEIFVEDASDFEVGNSLIIGPFTGGGYVVGETRRITAVDLDTNTITLNSALANVHEADDAVVEWIPATGTLDGEEVALAGKYLEPNAYVSADQYTGEIRVNFQFNPAGSDLFKQITESLVGKPLGIFLDDEPISLPIVEAHITGGQGYIRGGAMTRESANLLAIHLNAGALPIPLTLVKETVVDATLGADSIYRSIIAGAIGLGLILIFMLAYYRFPGLLADLALIIYAVLVLAIFKLVPVTLTLGGLAAFVLSIGMAVDANVLIFERMKEEVRLGKALGSAVEAGFDRAWPAIRDSNISTFIICGILIWLGGMLSEPSITGFGLTLLIGVAVSMFSAIFITRTLLRLVSGTPLARRMALFRI